MQTKFTTFLLAAAGLHLAFTLAIFLVGRARLMPTTFDAHGIGVSFAIDSTYYRVEAATLADTLWRGEFGKWAAARPQFHVKVYSLSFATFGRLLGPNILSAAPLNLVYYLLILSLVFALGREVFGREAGLLAAAVAAAWPSFLLHTTQMLRDPLFMVGVLALVLVLTTWLTREFSPLWGAAAGLAGGAACLVLWLIRGDMWEVSLALVLLGSAGFAVRTLRERRALAGNLVGAALLLALALVIPRVVPTYRQPSGPPPPGAAAAGAARPQPQPPKWSDIPARLMALRHKFITKYPLAGSNIDAHVELTSLKDILVYLPRALVVGLFAPFPNMWFVSGEMVGLKGRLLAGLEMVLMYAITAAAALCVWRRRRSPPVWLLALAVCVGAAALGYVVINLSTLYRMRYVFWMLIIILGADTLLRRGRAAEPRAAR